ncbi:MAG TPA: CDP-alcohol phosphatidyltransferase family protein [Tepidisphaeraceae bacterium]|nr:CDP-alcohol phosphatidyltransferase family protein [Tepidisphaeraceae bacterium]
MFRHIPNILTGLRLVLAAVFFAMLSYFQYEGRGNWLLNVAFIIYVIAMVTDYLDGHLARKWHVEGAFGRVVDPFVDKVLVLGTFIFFAGKNFIIPEPTHTGSGQMFFLTISGVAPYMVVILLARELLVTSLRGMAESMGAKFGADMGGKVKMGFQSGTILAILIYVNYRQAFSPSAEFGWRCLRDFGIWSTLAITIFSSFSYIRRGIVLFGRGNVPIPAETE